MMYSNLFAVNTSATYIRHVRVGKMIIKHQSVVFHLLRRLKGRLAVSALGIMHFKHSSIYIFSAENVHLMSQSPDGFVKNDYEPASCHANYFHRHARGFSEELHFRHMEQDKKKFRTFALL